jgi:hypothetical protein
VPVTVSPEKVALSTPAVQIAYHCFVIALTGYRLDAETISFPQPPLIPFPTARIIGSAWPKFWEWFRFLVMDVSDRDRSQLEWNQDEGVIYEFCDHHLAKFISAFAFGISAAKGSPHFFAMSPDYVLVVANLWSVCACSQRRDVFLDACSAFTLILGDSDTARMSTARAQITMRPDFVSVMYDAFILIQDDGQADIDYIYLWFEIVQRTFLESPRAELQLLDAKFITLLLSLLRHLDIGPLNSHQSGVVLGCFRCCAVCLAHAIELDIANREQWLVEALDANLLRAMLRCSRLIDKAFKDVVGADERDGIFQIFRRLYDTLKSVLESGNCFVLRRLARSIRKADHRYPPSEMTLDEAGPITASAIAIWLSFRMQVLLRWEEFKQYNTLERVVCDGPKVSHTRDQITSVSVINFESFSTVH